MSHPLSREIETLGSLIEFQYQTNDGVKWPVVALVQVLDLLDDYWETVENEEGESDPDLAAKILDEMYEAIHIVLVHQTIPMTEEQRTALEDQEVAELRDALEKFGKESGLDLKIMNLDQQLRDAQEKKEEKDE
jgi:hypothetical protein